MRILLIRLSSLGDIVLTTPVFSFIKENVPGVAIDFLTYSEYAALLEHDPAISRVLVLPKKPLLAALARGRCLHFVKILRAFLRDLTAYPYDHVIDLHNVTDSAFAALLCTMANGKMTNESGIRRRGNGQRVPLRTNRGARTGNRRQLLTLFFTNRLNIEERNEKAELHASLLAMLAVYASGALPETAAIPAIPESRLYFAAAADEAAARFLREHGLDCAPAPRAGIYPIASYAHKRWPLDRYARVAERIEESFGHKIILLGAAEDHALLQSLATETRARVVIACGLPLPVVIALIARLDYLLGADSGLMHIAAALDIPQLALFGPSSFYKFFPLSAKATVLRHDLACSPCAPKHAEKCPHQKCLTGISVDKVWMEIRALISRMFPDLACRCSCEKMQKEND